LNVVQQNSKPTGQLNDPHVTNVGLGALASRGPTSIGVVSIEVESRAASTSPWFASAGLVAESCAESIASSFVALELLEHAIDESIATTKAKLHERIDG
jgi:hypothetical protein